MDQEIMSALNVEKWTVKALPLYNSKEILLYDKWKKSTASSCLLGISEKGKMDVDIKTIDQELCEKYDADEDGYVHCEVLVTMDGRKYNEIEHEQIIRAFAIQQLKMDRLLNNSSLTDDSSPQEYIDWALNKGFEISWLDWAISEGYYKPKGSEKLVQTEFDDKEIKSMFKIILCLAKQGYKYDKHGSVTDMVNDIEKMDSKYHVSKNTLLKYLELANQII